jgi:hypothetical protein
VIVWEGEHGGSFQAREFTSARTLQGRDLVRATVAACWFLGPLRDRIRAPISLTSGKRSREHNATLPGASSTSLHFWDERGWAIDFVVRGIDARAIWRIVREESVGTFDRLCAYPDTGHCHVDWRSLGSVQRRRFYVKDETGNWVHHG